MDTELAGDLDITRAELENDRSTFDDHWRDIQDHILPRRGRFTTSDVNKGDKRNQRIKDPTATLALRTLGSGMLAGLTSPARPWFRLGVPDPALMEDWDVKLWCATTTFRMHGGFARSNLYNVLPMTYKDTAAFGTGCLYGEEDPENFMWFYLFPVGSYWLGCDRRGVVNTFMRKFRMTIRQIVETFGDLKPGTRILRSRQNLSNFVVNEWEGKRYGTWVDVIHFILPNQNWDTRMSGSQYKRFLSVYQEWGYSAGSENKRREAEKGTFLRISGYDLFPVMAPRWQTTGEDTYGTSCPGMDMLPDIKQLQVMQKRILQAIEKVVNPPMVAPTSLRNERASIIAGDYTYTDEREGQKGFRPAHEIRQGLAEVMAEKAEVRGRISKGFFENIMLMLIESDRREITATEIRERQEEKLLALAEVLERLNKDMFSPLIDIGFQSMVNQGLVPEPPDVIRGMPLRVEYISIMAQAQKLVSVAGIERFTGYLGSLIGQTGKTDIIDKVDTDQLVDEYGEAVSVPARVIRSDEMVSKIRQQRAEQEQALAAAKAAQSLGRAAKDLSGANLEDENALAAVLGQGSTGPAAAIG